MRSGYDANADGRILRSSGEQALEVTLRNTDDSLTVTLPDSSTVSIAPGIASVGNWVEFRWDIDLSANSGQGSGTLSYRDVTAGQVVWQTDASLTAINLGLNRATADKTNPENWDSIYVHMEGGSNGFDNYRATVDTPSGAVGFTENGAAVLLDGDVEVFDQELSGIDDLGGATLLLERNGGANSEDVFSATGNLVFNAGTLSFHHPTSGTVTNTGGTLTLIFAAGTTNAQVNEVMQSIRYANTSETPADSVQIDWTFNDQNSGAQGSGGALDVTGSTTVNITEVFASGTSDDDIIVGTTGADSFDGGAGNDIVLGGADLLGNGNFNSTSVDTQYAVTGTNSGWTISGGNVDFLGRDYQSLLRPTDANDADLRAVDLHDATISQTLSGLTIGETYSVAFMLGGESAGAHTVDVSTDGTTAGIQSISATMPGGNTLGTMDWQARVYTFTATSTSHTLSIASTSGSATDGPMIAGVRMVAHSAVDGNDTLRGGAGEDVVIGGGASDTIYGDAGVDTLLGGAGVDYFYANDDSESDIVDGGDGADWYYVYNNNVADRYRDTGASGTDTVYLRVLRGT